MSSNDEVSLFEGLEDGIVQRLRTERRFWITSIVVFAFFLLPSLLAYFLDPRMLNDINIWIKPIKFDVSLIAYLLTLSWFASYLPKSFLENTKYRIFSWIIVFCVFAELIWITGAAAAGTTSHFNNDSLFMGVVYGFMGVFAVTLISMSALYAYQFFKNDIELPLPVSRSIGLGLALTFILTLVVASYLSSQSGHLVGGNNSDAEGLALLGWATDGGDLRVAHFFATHALHFLPILGLLTLALQPRYLATTVVNLLAVAYAGFTLYVFRQAILGVPFLG